MLAAVVDAGGLTEGAARLGKSQPSLSRIIANLELRLGVVLFEKGKRPLRPTHLCQRLAAEGRAIAKASNAAADIARAFTSGTSGMVRVGGTPIFMDGVISSQIANFQSTYPDIRIDQSYGYPDDLVEKLQAGAVDMAICPLEAHQVPANLVFETLLPGQNVIACAKAHPLFRKASLRLQDIAEYPWIAQPAGSPLYKDLREVLSSIGIAEFKVSFSGGSLASILNVISGSHTLAVVPFSVVYMQSQHLQIGSLPIRIQHPKRNLGILTTGTDALQPSAQRFVDYLQSQFTGLSNAIVARQRNAVWRV